MLLERAERWPKQWKAEGRREQLKTQASHRFGELSQSAAQRIDRADIATLDRWSCRILDVKRLEDIFDDKPR